MYTALFNFLTTHINSSYQYNTILSWTLLRGNMGAKRFFANVSKVRISENKRFFEERLGTRLLLDNLTSFKSMTV